MTEIKQQHTENAGTKNSSEWEIVNDEREIFPSKTSSESFIYKVPHVKRSDGFTVLLETSTKGNTDRFLCKGDFGEFRFSAHRWDSRNEKPTDCYIISLFLCAPQDKKLCRLYSKNVEAALLHLPSSRMYDYKPVKEVLFKTSIGKTPPDPLLHASEVCHD